MKKNVIILSALFFSSFAFSQVGINTPDPKATLDITAKNSKGNAAAPEGLLVPRIDRERAQSMIGTTISTLVYVDDISTGLQTGTAINIDAVGYYYFDGRFWIKLNAQSGTNPMVNIYNSNGTLTGTRTVTMGTNSLMLNGTTGNFQVNGNNNGLYRSFFSNQSSEADSRMDVSIGAGASNIYLGTDRGSSIFGSDIKAYLDNRSGGRFVIGTSGVEQFTLDNTTGNVGIGNSAPTTKLSVVDASNTNSNQGIASFFANNLSQGVGIGHSGIQSIGTGDNVNFNLNSKGAGNIIMQTSGTTGNVGIGTTTPNNRLDLGMANGGSSVSSNLGKKLALFNNTAGTDFYGLGINTGYLQFHAGSTQDEAPGMVLSTAGSVGIGTTAPDSRAILDLSATNKGFLPPRLTTAQRNALTNRPAGLMIYNTDTNCMNFWNTSEWVSTCAAATPPAGAITAINCAGATNSGALSIGTAAAGVVSVIPYTGGNGGSHGGQTVTSTGVTGLTATLSAGNFANGAGNLTYNITGTPSALGTASFAINVGGQTCTLTRTVTNPAGTIASLNCSGATINGTLNHGVAASGVSAVISYTGGNGGSHTGQTIASTGVTGLTATLAAGSFVNGSGSLTYTITGTPSGFGPASFAINIGGRTCTLFVHVNASLLSCNGQQIGGAGNGGPYLFGADRDTQYYQCVRNTPGGQIFIYTYDCPPNSGWNNSLSNPGKCMVGFLPQQ